MLLKVNPNRMELLKLRRRIRVAKRGYKLLKDKFDELMKVLLGLVRETQKLRKEVEEKLYQAHQSWFLVRAETSTKELEAALIKFQGRVGLEVSEAKVMNIAIPKIQLKEEKTDAGYNLTTTPAALDKAVDNYHQVLPLMIKLAEKEKKIQLMAVEIERVRRRVNALEYILIPQLEDTIKFITMKLDEIERANLTRLLKVKQMVH